MNELMNEWMNEWKMNEWILKPNCCGEGGWQLEAFQVDL